MLGEEKGEGNVAYCNEGSWEEDCCEERNDFHGGTVLLASYCHFFGFSCNCEIDLTILLCDEI